MEFTDRFKKACEGLRKKGKFCDDALRHRVYDRMFELGEDAGDDCLTMYDFVEGDECADDDDYWLGIHCLACWLGLERLEGV